MIDGELMMFCFVPESSEYSMSARLLTSLNFGQLYSFWVELWSYEALHLSRAEVYTV